MKEQIAFLIAFGPEVRAFLHSGLAEQLVSMGSSVVVFTTRPESLVFKPYGNLIKILPLPIRPRNKFLYYLSYQTDKVTETWIAKKGYRRWRHYLPQTSVRPGKFQTFFREIFANRAGLFVLSIFETLIIKLYGTDFVWKKLLLENNIKTIVVSSYSSPRILPAIQTAYNLSLRLCYVANSWKDIYASIRVPIHPDKLVLPTESSARDIKIANPGMRADSIVVVPSLHLQKVIEQKQKYSLTDSDHAKKDYIFYTAAAPTALKNEEAVVEILLGAISKGQFRRKIKLLLRLNPMENGSRFQSLYERFPKILEIQKPLWEYLPEYDWCSPLQEDSNLFISSLAQSAMNISVPSTVSLEAIFLGVPVVNICFDFPEKLPIEQSARRFWDAGFYHEIQNHSLIHPVFSREELINKVNDLLSLMPEISASELTPSTTPVDVLSKLLVNLFVENNS
jgi:hypothetical protein